MLSEIIGKFAEKKHITANYVDQTLDNIVKIHKVDLTKIKYEETKKEILDRLPNEILYTDFLSFISDYIVSKSSFHPDYGKLASVVNVYRLHHVTSNNIADVVSILYNYYDKQNAHSPIISESFFKLVTENADKINDMINYGRDYDFDYFGLKTLERSYLLKVHHGNKSYIIERPQHLFMRVAIGLHGEIWEDVFDTYQNLSLRYFTHATPTLFNIGTNRGSLSSCFLCGVDDSLDSILTKIKEIGMISKWAGGIGVHLSSIRAKGSIIRGTNGLSDGIIPLCNVLNKLARYVNQGGKRGGAIACFCENTEILTMNEGVKKIQDVKIGDLVVTHKNRVRPVEQVHKNPLQDRKIYKLKVEKNKDIYVTGNHKFWARCTKRNKREIISTGWTSIEELKTFIDKPELKGQSCYISIPSATDIIDSKDYKIDVIDFKNVILNDTVKELKEDNQNKITAVSTYFDQLRNEKNTYSHTVNRIWNITEDLANLFGIWLGDGHIRKSRTKYILGICFTVHKENIKEIDFIIKVCTNTFNCNITCFTPKSRNVTHITVNSHIIGSIFMEMFGCYFNGKKLPNFVFSWPKNLINSLMAGLITTDGHIRKDGSSTLGLSNETLMTQLYHLCRNNGMDVSFVKGKAGKGMTCDPYYMSIPLSVEILSQTHKLYKDNRIEQCYEMIKKNEWIRHDKFLKVFEITETDRKDEYVYTLGIKEDHSYTVEGLLAQNCYLEPHCADIFEFVELRKQNSGNEDNRARDLFLALWISDLFMKRVEANEMWSLMCPDECPGLNKVYGKEFEELYTKYENEKRYKRQVRARDLWEHIMECQIETGMPYMLYKDNVNHKSNQQNIGTIASSNLCVHSDTMILTKLGYQNIKSLEDKNTEVWNGKEWSDVIVKKTGTNKDLIRVNLSNGSFLDCTPEHKFYTQAKYTKSKISESQAQNLRDGEKLIKLILPDVLHFGNDEFKYPYTHGFFCGDGTYDKGRKKNLLKPKLYLYGEKQKLIDNIIYKSKHSNQLSNRIDVYLPNDLAPKFTVPLDSSVNIRLRWFEGYCDADGCIAKTGTSESIQICSIEKNFLINVRFMLHTLGVESKIVIQHEERETLLPDGKNGKKLFQCKQSWRLLVSSSGLYKLSQLGFSPKRLQFTPRKPNRNAEQFVQVVSIEKSYQNVDTYCFTEPKRHMGVFNGILTGQCAEIVQYSDADETATCNLASLCLPRFIDYTQFGIPVYNYKKLQEVTRLVIRNLNIVIDINFYPSENSKVSNMKHRPVGLGVSGLADVYNIFECGFESEKASLLNKKIFETIYYAALDESKELAKKHGHYKTFAGSPFSKGILQYHMWGMKNDDLVTHNDYDWGKLVEEIKEHGTRNSLLTALMPTASTAQIMKCSETMEPFMSNVFTRTTLAGEFVVINENLVKMLEKYDLWNCDMRKLIILHNGSIQNIDGIPEYIKKIYKTAFEIPLKSIISQSADRAIAVDQSQSLNLFMETPDYKKLTSAHFYSWKRGNKTSSYYTRTNVSSAPHAFGIDINDAKRLMKKDKEEPAEQTVCTSCSA